MGVDLSAAALHPVRAGRSVGTEDVPRSVPACPALRGVFPTPTKAWAERMRPARALKPGMGFTPTLTIVEPRRATGARPQNQPDCCRIASRPAAFVPDIGHAAERFAHTMRRKRSEGESRPATLGTSANWPICWCKVCRHEVDLDPAEQIERYKPVRFAGIAYGQAELEFRDVEGDEHTIWVDAAFVRPA